MTPQEATKARQDLRRTIKRADSLSARCLSQTCDGDLLDVDRESAEKRLHLSLRAVQDLEGQLVRLNEAMSQ